MILENNQKIKKNDFIKEIDKIKDRLPSYYGVLVHHKLPNKSMRKIYNVKNYGTVDMEILNALQEIACHN